MDIGFGLIASPRSRALWLKERKPGDHAVRRVLALQVEEAHHQRGPLLWSPLGVRERRVAAKARGAAREHAAGPCGAGGILAEDGAQLAHHGRRAAPARVPRSSVREIDERRAGGEAG